MTFQCAVVVADKRPFPAQISTSVCVAKGATHSIEQVKAMHAATPSPRSLRTVALLIGGRLVQNTYQTTHADSGRMEIRRNDQGGAS